MLVALNLGNASPNLLSCINIYDWNNKGKVSLNKSPLRQVKLKIIGVKFKFSSYERGERIITNIKIVKIYERAGNIKL